METVLTLSVGGFPPLSARGCEQILKPIKLGEMKRTVNGELIHLGPQELKYQSIIRAKDRTVLASNGLYPGVVVKVGCIQQLWERVDDPFKPHTIMRKAIAGSMSVIDEDQNKVHFSQKDRVVDIGYMGKKEIFITYRPELSMRIIDFIIKTNEWTFESSWELCLEEI